MTSHEGDHELMQLHDGELPAEDAARLEQELARDPARQAALADLEHIGDVVRGVAEERGRAGDSIADAVMARIEQDQAAATPVSVPLWRRSAPVGAAVLAMAAAAVLVLHAHAPIPTPSARVVPPPQVPAHQPASAEVATDRVTAPAPPQAEVDDGAPAVAIESVDFGSRNGTIFMVQSGQNETPVVWLVDEPPSPGARIEPL